MERDQLDQAYDELYADMLEHGGPSFVLQHIVDAYGAQTVTERDKPIRVVFALVGLYLHLEHHFSGRQVQQVHMRLGRFKRQWPPISLPPSRGEMTPIDVMAVPPGVERERAVDAWCRAVWLAFAENRNAIVDLLRREQVIG